MATNLNVAMAPKDSTFQVRINSEIKRTVEDIYAKTGMTLTDIFIMRKKILCGSYLVSTLLHKKRLIIGMNSRRLEYIKLMGTLNIGELEQIGLTGFQM